MSVVLLGGGGHASDVLCVIEALADQGDDLYPVHVADDAWDQPERFEDRGEVKMVESIEAGASLAPFIVSVGFPGGRRKVHDIAVGIGGKSASAIAHPATSIGANVQLRAGVVIMGQTWVSARVAIGRHTHVGYGVTIGHDTRIGEFSAIMPGSCLGGDITIGSDVLIGANATVLQGLTIGEGATVGAGAVVIKDVEPGSTVVGVPAVAKG